MNNTDSTLLDHLSGLTTFRVHRHPCRVVIYGSGGEQIGSGDTLREAIEAMAKWLDLPPAATAPVVASNTVTPDRITDLLARSDIVVRTEFGKVTIVTARLPNGFVLVESAGVVDPRNYREEVGREICLKRIENKLWELEGYVLSTDLQRNANNHPGDGAAMT